jgi:hypothetical protein
MCASELVGRSIGAHFPVKCLLCATKTPDQVTISILLKLTQPFVGGPHHLIVRVDNFAQALN